MDPSYETFERLLMEKAYNILSVSVSERHHRLRVKCKAVRIWPLYHRIIES